MMKLLKSEKDRCWYRMTKQQFRANEVLDLVLIQFLLNYLR